MRYRDYKEFRQGHYYHIYNRGQNLEPVFLDEQDYDQFLDRFQMVLNQKIYSRFQIKPFPTTSFTIIAYCLMKNHFHFLIRQNSIITISRLMQKVTTSYARYFNSKYKRIGNVFQDTFKSKQVEKDQYLTYLTAYIHNNPAKPAVYFYSSFREYMHKPTRNICDTGIVLKYFNNRKKIYKNFVDCYKLKEHTKIRHLEFED